jgi:hypothetical protein
MARIVALIFLVSLFAVNSGLYAQPALADDDGGRHSRVVDPAKVAPQNELHVSECSSCHFAFLPGLLPAKNWELLMKNTNKHFGEDLGLDEATKAGILKFLKANSAENTPTKWARIIVKSARPDDIRISRVPWMFKEHHLKEAVFKRPSIQTRSNCIACHPDAAKGDFNEHRVKIPKE